MAYDILKAILIGIIVAAPLGPVLILVIQKTMCKGRSAGMMTGLGSAFVDTMYAVIGLFALSIVENFVDANLGVILLAGGAVVVLFGLNLLMSHPKMTVGQGNSTASLFSCTLQAMGSALSNPGAIAVMMALLALFGMSASDLEAPVWAVFPSVALGEMLWWSMVTFLLTHFVRVKEETMLKLNRLFGIILIVIGLVLIVRGIITIWK